MPACAVACDCVAEREVARPKPLPPDSPPPRYRVVFRDGAARKSWDVLVRERGTDMIECWDHLAFRAPEDLPRRCKALIGRFSASGLRQFAVGPKQRVWYRVSRREVTIVTVHRTHPKQTD